MQRTLILVKPDAFSRGLTGEVIARFERKGLKVVGLRLLAVPREWGELVPNAGYTREIEGTVESIRTLAAAGVSRFKDMYRHFLKLAPLQQHVTIEDIGNTAVFLSSELAAKVTGEVLYVDSGYNIVGVPEPPECE